MTQKTYSIIGDNIDVSELEFGLPWDGHSCDDVVRRILEWIK